MKTLLLWVLALLFISSALSSCDDESDQENPAPLPVTVEFTGSEIVLKENDGEKTITIKFSKELSTNGTIGIAFDTAFTKFFGTTPSLSNGLLVLLVPKNSSSASFKITPVNNTISDGNKRFSAVIKEVSEGLHIGVHKTQSLTIEDDDSPAQVKDSYVNFVSSNATIKENNTEWHEIQLHVSEASTVSGSVIVQAESEKAIYGTHYITEPAFDNSILTLVAASDSPVIKFKILTINNDFISGDAEIRFSIKATTGNVKAGITATDFFRISDDELEGMPKGYEAGGGNWSLKKTYEYNPDGGIAKVIWESYTPYHRSGMSTYFYNDRNQLTRINTNPGQDLLYYYEGDRIVKEQKVDNGEIDRYTEYGYDDHGNVASYRTFYLQPDGNFALSTIGLLLYYLDGNLYKQLINTPPVNPFEDLYLVSTTTFENYRSQENPFPMVEILPGIKTQKTLPTTYRHEANGHDLLYNLSYEYRQDGKVSKRIATRGNTSEVAVYHYY